MYFFLNLRYAIVSNLNNFISISPYITNLSNLLFSLLFLTAFCFNNIFFFFLSQNFKILKFVFNFKFPQMNIGIHLENYRSGLYIKHAELSFHKYEKYDQDLVQAKKRTREMAYSWRENEVLLNSIMNK